MVRRDRSFMVTGVPDGPLTLTTEQLQLMDRMLTAYLLGVLDWLGSGVETTPAGFAGVAAAAPPVPQSDQELLEALRIAKSQAENGGKVLVGSLAMLVTIAGAYGASALFAFLAGTAAAATLVSPPRGLRLRHGRVAAGTSSGRRSRRRCSTPSSPWVSRSVANYRPS